MKKEKRGSGNEIWFLILFILMIIAVAIGIFALFNSGIIDKLGIFPKWGSSNSNSSGEDDALTSGRSKTVIFTFNDGAMLISDLSYAYVDGIGWEWSDGKEWMSVKNLENSQKQTPTQANIDFIISLQDADFKKGVVFLIDRTLRNSEGGFWDAELVVKIGGSKWEYEKSMLNEKEKFFSELTKRAGITSGKPAVVGVVNA